MGCGCNKGKNQAPAALATRQTVYQAIDASKNVVGEFPTIQEARSKAVEVGGIVRVSTKAS